MFNTRLDFESFAIVCAACCFGMAIWTAQEWAIHKHLFHGNIDWFGKAIHEDHHKAPFYQISIDDGLIAVGVMVLSTTVLAVCLGAHFGMDASLGYVRCSILPIQVPCYCVALQQ